MPVFMVEAVYEFENIGNHEPGTPLTLRRQAYWSYLSGTTGQLYGNKYTWQFLSGWKSHLDTPGSVQFGYAARLFAKRPWYRLVPDQKHDVVTSGYGAFGTSNYVTAAATPDGTLAIAYLPTAGTISVDMGKLAGAARAQWFDPANGKYSDVSGSPFANSGTRTFTPPAKNSSSDTDWVLVLSASKSGAAPAPLTEAATGKTAHAARPEAITAAADDTSADVFAYQVDRDDPVAVGGQIAYTITVGDNGPNRPPGSPSPTRCPRGRPSSPPNRRRGHFRGAGTVTCTFGTITEAGGETRHRRVRPSGAYKRDERGRRHGRRARPGPWEHGASEETTVSPVSADLAVLQTDDADPAPLGADVTYTLTVSNYGPSTADGVTLSTRSPPERTSCRPMLRATVRQARESSPARSDRCCRATRA